ncbi:amidohydrolase family protein [Frankia sp. CNm7]|uniref:Amidohydrolase family protein n=2 Tax=Frankia nepalensis TaxID=1836974 RepID=A0A937RQP4_9ACTN|nr:amidohydrolase family protein [Frankia nepalensis]MBL7512917.1 amidohydrolase family protein [Frankia nepalensis]MBL7521651.1 amidohydrolase family protein [Frankia nepalensis]MBL7633220.1 amidohydrolase family protein [Frankia nepalensis]
MKRRGVQVLQDGKRAYIVIAGKINRFIPNPTFDPVIVPGCTELLFRGEIPDGVDPKSLTAVEPIHPEYRDREERLKVMDAQGLAAVLMFPTLGVGVEQGLRHDPEATAVALTAFNRWLEDDWGFAYQNRIFGAPMISLADPDAALVEIESLLARGARAVHLRPAPIPAADGPRSFGHPANDPVWSLLAEAGVPVAFHLGDSGYLTYSAAWGGASDFEPFGGRNDPLDQVLVDDRAIYDTMASMITHGVFHRHPTLRVASVENGSDWVAILAKRLRKKANQAPAYFPEDPLDVLRRNVWVTPYYEEDIPALAETIGVGHVLFGSDWPHGEGLADPVQFTKELHGFSEADIRKIMRDNVIEYLGVDSVAS